MYFEKKEKRKFSAVGNSVTGYDDRTSERTLGRKRVRSEELRLCCHLCQIADYIFVDRSGQKRELIGETRPKNIRVNAGDRRI